MEPASDPSLWLRVGEFLASQFGPGGLVLFLVAAGEAWALREAIKYFGTRDEQKRGDVLAIVKDTKEALKELSAAVGRLQVVIAANTGRSDV